MNTVTKATNAVRLIELEQQWNSHMAEAERPGLSDKERNFHTSAVVSIELEIAAAPCDSREAFMAKLRTVVRNGLVYGQVDAIDDAALIDAMIAFIEGQGATGRAEA